MSSNLNEENVGGYSVAYSRDDTYFPIYVMALLAAVFLGAAWFTGGWYWLLFAAATAAFTYYNLPLLETGRPTIGANQYGIFLQAFGLIRWRAIKEINLVPIADRAMITEQLQIVLNVPLASALVVDWRKQPLYRALMRRPWRLDKSGFLQVNLEPFDQPAAEIHGTFLRMWRYYRS
ncbi:hypothetical protein [Bradyrhizobium prioriisuperbiae]|uniref:hypothetical protein n=1 Tax=Bradyrhizobium prioriisuperbiae TaxID=2854389 RepID=UPI0028EC6645|nr:hypothetical protein [Bradyrhizobium prioritasuperba]